LYPAANFSNATHHAQTSSLYESDETDSTRSTVISRLSMTSINMMSAIGEGVPANCTIDGNNNSTNNVSNNVVDECTKPKPCLEEPNEEMSSSGALTTTHSNGPEPNFIDDNCKENNRNSSNNRKMRNFIFATHEECEFRKKCTDSRSITQVPLTPPLSFRDCDKGAQQILADEKCLVDISGQPKATLFGIENCEESKVLSETVGDDMATLHEKEKDRGTPKETINVVCKQETLIQDEHHLGHHNHNDFNVKSKTVVDMDAKVSIASTSSQQSNSAKIDDHDGNKLCDEEDELARLADELGLDCGGGLDEEDDEYFQALLAQMDSPCEEMKVDSNNSKGHTNNGSIKEESSNEKGRLAQDNNDSNNIVIIGKGATTTSKSECASLPDEKNVIGESKVETTFSK